MSGRWAKSPEWLIDALIEHCDGRERASFPHAFAIWGILAAKHATRDGSVHRLSHARLAAESRFGVSTVRRALAALEDVGALDTIATRKGEHQGANRYRLHFDGPCSRGDSSQVPPSEQQDREAAGHSGGRWSERDSESRKEFPDSASAPERRSPREGQLGMLDREGEPEEWLVAAVQRSDRVLSWLADRKGRLSSPMAEASG